MDDIVIQVTDLTKIYMMGLVEVHALDGVTFNINRGEMVAIMGPSGSGKSTLMNLLGCLDRPSGGNYTLDGEEVSTLNDDQLARQTSLANVELPLRYAGVVKERKARAEAALISVGLADRITHRPTELSGGQQQRVAIARALVNHPAILMADEPTGNLDSKSGKEIMQLLLDLNHKGTTVIIVTHDPTIADQTQRIIRLRDGLIEGDAV
jgi:putative ABC transport system ATP-binding protein